MAIDFETSESTEVGSSYLKEPGVFHLIVTVANESPQKKNGEYMNAIQFEVDVLAGPHKGQKAEITLFNPTLDSKDQGKFARLVQTRFLEVVGLIRPEQLGRKVQIELKNAEGRQFIGKFKKQDDSEFLKLDGGKIWHVDDPNAEVCERDQQAIDRLIPKELRRDPASFKKSESSSGGSGSSATGGTYKPSIDPNDL